MKPTKQQNNQNKLRNKFLKAGVKMTGPETIFFSGDTKIGKGVTIEPYVVIGSKVKIGNNVITDSGIHGRIVAVDEKTVTLVLKKGEAVIDKSKIFGVV